MATIIDGKRLAAEVRERASANVADLAKRGVPCGLAVVLVGDDQGSATYVRAKLRDCEECGIPSRDYKLPASTTQADLMELVASSVSYTHLDVYKRQPHVLSRARVPLDEPLVPMRGASARRTGERSSVSPSSPMIPASAPEPTARYPT